MTNLRSQPAPVRGMNIFLMIWIGQLVSMTGSGLTGFALGLWVYNRTGSVTEFALVSFFTLLPGILFAPLAGALVDRWDKRMTILFSDLAAGLTTILIVALLLAGDLRSWELYLVLSVRSLCSVLRWPAFASITPDLVNKEQLVRANAMIQIGQGASQILPPVLAGALIAVIDTSGVIMIDIGTFLFAIITLLPLLVSKRYSAASMPASAASGNTRSGILSEVVFGWRYLHARRGLVALLLLFAVVNGLLGTVSVLATPLILSVASEATLGVVLSIGGSGMLVGSVMMSIWGGPARKMKGVYLALLAVGLCLVLVGIRPSVPLFAVAAFGFFFALAVVNTCAWAIWQSRVPKDVRGRVFAMVQMVAQASLPLGNLGAGPLADRVFEPLLAVGGPLSGTVGTVIGVGPGRGIGLLFIVMGLGVVLVTAAGYRYRPLRQVEDDLPDSALHADPGGGDDLLLQPAIEAAGGGDLHG